jgi:Thioesterase superfamily.
MSGRISYIHDFEQWEKEFRFSVLIRVRFSETDLYGHVNNTVPFAYFEYARIEFFKWLGFMQEWLNPACETIPVVADLQCDFLAQMFFDEEIEIFVKAAHIGNSSVDLHYLGKKKKDGTVCITGRGTMVQVHRRTGKAIAWSKEMRELLEKGKVMRVNG